MSPITLSRKTYNKKRARCIPRSFKKKQTQAKLLSHHLNCPHPNRNQRLRYLARTSQRPALAA